MRLSEADGRPVLSRATAESLGELRHVVVDAATRRITALHVSGRGRRAGLVGWADVVGFGPDGIVVAGEDAIRPPAGDREEAVVRGRLDLDGRLVLDDHGDAAGPLTDLLFDEATGAVRAVIFGDVAIPATRLRAIGPYCVLVRAEDPVAALPAGEPA
ncbi:MAG: PRC-barrel domain-containing protein [Thermoleophilia bacterium]